MKKSNLYKAIKFHFEDQYEQINTQIYGKINHDLIQNSPEWRGIWENLYGSEEEKFNSIHPIILKEEYDIFLFYQIIEKYKYHFFHSILWFIKDICGAEYEKTQEYLIAQFCNSPYIDTIEKQGNHFEIHSILGDITFQTADSYLHNIKHDDLVNFIKKENPSGFCHYSTAKVCSSIENSFAYTTLCPHAFKGQFYHSFTVHDGVCIDLNYQCVIPLEEYKQLTQFELLQKTSHHLLPDVIESFSEYEDPLLYHALNEQAKKKIFKN